MNRNPIDRLRQEIEDRASAKGADTYDMMNVRPGSKISVMIELLAELWGVPVSTMLTDELSERLALHAASDLEHAQAILNAATAYIAVHGEPSEDSALGRLLDRGVLKIERRAGQG